ncbi:hypothetical protein CTA1_8276 [Colletotrichum tanaceti]|uniref:Uncharacterized protein n=1 Tax=Colletotrichum tanaceti TaxID=1306861 RepID=A0A4U6XK66_9PEZI|nr:hypothetical protein CTA1_8276 [Colletotrichum tanaceti]
MSRQQSPKTWEKALRSFPGLKFAIGSYEHIFSGRENCESSEYSPISSPTSTLESLGIPDESRIDIVATRRKLLLNTSMDIFRVKPSLYDSAAPVFCGVLRRLAAHSDE